jgi:3',5'-cyclic AMP phosphodiesterase CpdA
VPTRALHLSDLHAGRHEAPGLAEALTALVAEIEPELVLATGDVSHRGRPEQLARAKELLDGLGAPVLALPGNHDIPYTVPARFTAPWVGFEHAFGTVDPVYRSESLVVCGLNSVRPWRHQGGRLSPARLERAAETLAQAPAGALRVVALHHHLAGAPWRTSRKFPLKHRDHALRALAAAGAELVAGGHIHQSTTVERREFDVDAGAGTVVLATAPGLGRPRPHRLGEAQGVHVYEWDEERLSVVTRIWDGASFRPTARRSFPRSG